MGSIGSVDPSQAVDGLVRAMRDLTADTNYKIVADVFSEFLFLKEHNNRLSNSHVVVLEEYRKFRNELESHEALLIKEKGELEQTIKEKVQESHQLSAIKIKLEGDLEDTIKSLELEKSNAADAAKAAAKELADLQAAKVVVEDAKKDAEDAAAAAAAAAAQEIAALTEAKTGLEEVKASNEAEIASLQGNVAGLEGAKAALEEVKVNKEAEIEKLKENIATLEEEKKKVEEALEAANQKIASLNDTVAHKDTEIESLHESLRAVEEQIGSLQQTVDDKNGEIDDLHGRLKAETERAENAIAHGNDLQTKLEETDHDLQAMTGRFEDLEQYRIELEQDSEDSYVTVLDKIWTTLVHLVENTFRPDIDESILADQSCWTNLRNSQYLKHATQLQVPLPPSNSPAAKGMRISAVLAVLSRALHKHVFRPVYILEDDDEGLVKFLRTLEDEDPSREAHMRATLLSMMPERQLDQGARRVKTVVREVSWLVQHLLSALQFEAFCSGLESACRVACEQWRRIQIANIKIEPYFGPPYDDFDWQVLELPEFAEAAEGEDAMTVTIDDHDDGATVTDGPLETVEASEVQSDGAAGDANAMFDNLDASSQQNLEHGVEDMEEEDGDCDIDPDEILLVVWPSMCLVENGELMSITQGLVISKEQARPALEEVRSRSRQPPRPGSRRARTMSMPGQSRGNSPRGKSAHFLAIAQTASEPAGGIAVDGGADDG
ncbi:hypothetical protein B0T26DRAFT_647847 [Lasiosphaeria miniovina]|uniref:Uncharacterized protein n=1 Tax=Lasiosphaeria miniovina TaxID=1954250 RepID=A0AA40AMI3_9PEZI|nr:uncharacterized protein B0T26DRAFT_647847 [Lasiosphaeria miniovina]KAK0718592.1 hypothetical protein B0T26DRAFT_647847 [Lasiosphaeria miniovina]